MQMLKGILIPGTSPVSLFYSLLCARSGLICSLVGEEPFGGPWQQTSCNASNLSYCTATHIGMFSYGFEKLLNTIGFTPTAWSLNPNKKKKNGIFLEYFGTGENREVIGNISGTKNIMEYLLDEVKKNKNIHIIKDKIKNIEISNKVLAKTINNGAFHASGLVLTNGIDCSLKINGKNIVSNSTKFCVETLCVEVTSIQKLPETFVHIESSNSLIREFQITALNDRSIVLAKLSRFGRVAGPEVSISQLENLIYKIFGIIISKHSYKLTKYLNNRYIFDVPVNELSKIPAIFPAKRSNNSNTDELLISQDLSKLFFNLDRVQAQINEKFKKKDRDDLNGK